MSDDEPPLLHAFQGYGIELEYMIVDRDHLSILPIADRLLGSAAENGGYDVKRGTMGWSNEMVQHVIEIKNLRPSSLLSELPETFQSEVQAINHMLQKSNARLMPTAMHPWMDPHTETQLWLHDNEVIYRTYDRIFDSKRHGWANLQSMHINLPFADDSEFARLHAAVRLTLPILPALAASSPIAEERNSGCMDYRMQVYWSNADVVPSIAAQVIPETVSSRAEYEKTILAPMYRDIAPFDPEGVLRHEWLNSRGGIARFDRNAIEIRVVDTQECPRADMAIAAAASYLARRLYIAGENELDVQQAASTETLAAILRTCICAGEEAVIDSPDYLALLGFPEPECHARELWSYLIEQMLHDGGVEGAELWNEPLQVILREGPLARRILRAAGGDYSREKLIVVYRELCGCLDEGKMFSGVE